MPSILVIEDGTGVEDANSYATYAEALAWVALRGLSFGSLTQTQVENKLLQAMDLLESYRNRYQGEKADSTQALQWPRSNVYIDGTLWVDDEIPPDLISAQIRLAYDAQTQTLQPVGTGREVKRRKVDVLETEYFQSGSKTVTAQFNAAMAFLSPLFNNTSTFGTLLAYRV